MRPVRVFSLLLPLLLAAAAPSAGGEPVDWEMVGKIRAEGFHRSQVMETMEQLTDEIGPRLTGSPGMTRANEWTRGQLEEWGLSNARLEPFGPFGRGWSFTRTSVHLLSPRAMPLLALPKAWTPGTDGPVRGTAIHAVIEEEDDFEEWTGKLEGRIVFLRDARPIDPEERAPFRRYSDTELDEITEFHIPEPRDRAARRKRFLKRRELRRKLNEFLTAEKVLAVVEPSSRNGGTIRVTGGGSREPGEDPGPTALAMMVEHYNWILRMLAEDREVELEIDVTAAFHDEDPMAYNTLAEIPGSGDGLVMVGAHLDSWHAAAGSNDNAAGCAVAMEAVRILAALGVEPKRTIRVALWSGEEQGLLGSRAHVFEHFAAPPTPEDEEEARLNPALWKKQFPLTLKPAHEDLSAYFNLDNGSGKIRGIYTQENTALVPVFEAWLRPFHDLGADTVTNRNTGGTDHQAFDAVGLPGFQFIQDGLDYFSRTHHTNLDTLDRARAEDLKQASVVMASFLYHAAMRDERLPREPMPQPPPAKEEEDDSEDEDDGEDEDAGGP